LDQFHFNADRPHTVTIRGRDDDWKSWETCINNTIKPGVDFCVFILPGAKGKGKCYNEIKRNFITKMPVPTQVVLASTISRGKNLRSIVTKILI